MCAVTITISPTQTYVFLIMAEMELRTSRLMSFLTRIVLVFYLGWNSKRPKLTWKSFSPVHVLSPGATDFQTPTNLQSWSSLWIPFFNLPKDCQLLFLVFGVQTSQRHHCGRWRRRRRCWWWGIGDRRRSYLLLWSWGGRRRRRGGLVQEQRVRRWV